VIGVKSDRFQTWKGSALNNPIIERTTLVGLGFAILAILVSRSILLGVITLVLFAALGVLIAMQTGTFHDTYDD